MGKIRYSRFDCSPGCSVEAAIALIDGKWKAIIMYHLLSGTMRFNEISRRLGCITQRMLSKQLRELEDDGLVARRIYAEVPPKVEYSLTPLGRSMGPIFLAMKSWGDAHIGLYGKPSAVSRPAD